MFSSRTHEQSISKTLEVAAFKNDDPMRGDSPVTMSETLIMKNDHFTGEGPILTAKVKLGNQSVATFELLPVKNFFADDRERAES